MTLIRLTNERWGFSTNCFVCEPTNDDGMRLQFFHDDERDLVTCSFELGSGFTGTPNYLHGGVTQAILDEIQSWATIAVAGKFALTTRTTVSFHKPVRVGKTYTAEAEITSVADDVIEAVGRILDDRGGLRTEATTSFAVISAAVAADAIGDVGGDDARYLKGG